MLGMFRSPGTTGSPSGLFVFVGSSVNQRAPFTADDLAEMDDALFSRASAVVAMEDVNDGNRDPNSIGLRHDVDGTNARTRHALQTAVQMAEWEAARGYRSTYYILHTAPYWMAAGFAAALDRIAELGHEIGIHADCLAEAMSTGRDPDQILDEALATLRGLGFQIRGVVGHGNPLCNRDAAPGEPWFANDEQFDLCRRPDYGAADRIINRGSRTLKLAPRPLADFGLEYEALWSAHPFAFRISDSGGKWLNPGWDETVVKWQGQRAAYGHVTSPTREVRQLHALVHPDWWQHAFVEERIAA